MIDYKDIHLEDLKNLTFKSFSEILINDYYPFLYSELNKIEDMIRILKVDYDVDILESIHKKIYGEFDELFRKEKLVLFPFILKLDEENLKSENCAPFKNTKAIYKSIIICLNSALEKLANLFVNDVNEQLIYKINSSILNFKQSMIELQLLKDRNFYKNYKSCSGCGSLGNE